MREVYDAIVVGAGFAGLSAALELTDSPSHLTVALLTTTPPQEGGCSRYVQGINAAMGVDDSPEDHAQDTLRAGADLNDPSLVKVMCESAPDVIRSLKAWGVPFQTNDEGIFEVGLYGGSKNRRSLHWQDTIGEKILEVLHHRLLNTACDILLERHALELVRDSDGLCRGVVCINRTSSSVEIFRSKAVILATGGGACVYPFRSISPDKVASGLLMAFRSGCLLTDMEMVQFHPTGLYSEQPEGRGIALEEELRTLGGCLRNIEGNAFMSRYDAHGDLATRDVVSRGIATEVLEGRGTAHNTVYFDLSAIPPERIEVRFPNMCRRLKSVDVDIRSNPILEVAPTAHYLMGGVVIDSKAHTSVHGLFVCGEDAGGIHGGNRVGGNGAIDALVFGRCAGRAAVECVEGTSFSGSRTDPPEIRVCNVGNTAVRSYLDRIESIMGTHVSVIRTTEGLRNARAELADIEASLATQTRNESVETGRTVDLDIIKTSELLDKATLAQLIASAAFRREASAGAHFRLARSVDHADAH